MEKETIGKDEIKEKKCYKVKIIVVGDASVGKTNIVYRFVNRQFMNEYCITIGADFFSYNLEFDDKIFKLVIMDTAGSERFRSVTRGYYKNCSFALIVYDITDKKSFNSIKQWIEECHNYANKNIHMVLVGNKIDLNEERKISKEEGKELADEFKMDFFETSAKTGENIEDIFLLICEFLSSNIDEGKYDLNDPSSGVSIEELEEGFKLNKSVNQSKNEEKKGCC